VVAVPRASTVPETCTFPKAATTTGRLPSRRKVEPDATVSDWSGMTTMSGPPD
jgi:hypothetical protein